MIQTLAFIKLDQCHLKLMEWHQPVHASVVYATSYEHGCSEQRLIGMDHLKIKEDMWDWISH